MARELRRLLIEANRLAAAHAGAGLTLRAEEHHYLSRVLRLRPGDALAVVDGCGGLWRCRLGEGPWLADLEATLQAPPAAAPSLTLAMALPRQEVELVWRMACELGIDRLQPLRSERCQLPDRRQAMDRWQAVLREATEQSERLWLPLLEPLRPAQEWLAQEGKQPGLALLATTRRSDLEPLETVLAGRIDPGSPPDQIRLAIGPEGGWSPGEEELAEAAGWRPVSLGETILRCSTAAVTGASRLVSWRQLSCASCRGPSPGSRPDPPLPGGDAGAESPPL